MSWIRLDTNMFDHPKVLALLDAEDGDETGRGWRALCLYFFGLTYSGKHGLDGFVPRAALRTVGLKPADARLLVEVGLWESEDTAGWNTHGWAERQLSDDEAKARSAKARKAAQARWRNHGSTALDPDA